MRKSLFWLILVLLTYSLVELCSFGGLYYLQQFGMSPDPANRLSRKHEEIIGQFLNNENRYTAISSTLGWSIRNNGAFAMYQANSAGIRSSVEYESATAAGVYRVLAFGDSYTHGDNVHNSNTWQSIMERLGSNVEVLNFGVGGYGLDQAYLRYLENEAGFQSKVVLIGFMSENIHRNVNTFRPFYFPNTGIPLSKPRFKLVDEELRLLPNPLNNLQNYQRLLQEPEAVLAEIGQHDFYFQRAYLSGPFDWSPTARLVKLLRTRVIAGYSDESTVIDGQYNTSSEAFKVTVKLFEKFYQRVIANKSTPVILVFPNRRDIQRFHAQGTRQYDPLLASLDKTGYRYIDMMDAFEGQKGGLFIKGHYSVYANNLVARHILKQLLKMNTAVSQ